LFVERVESLNDQRLAGGALAADARLERRASAPESASGPGPLLYALVAVAAGMLLGGGIALLLESRANNWRDARDAELTLRAPVLGVIPEYPSGEED
jgi:capsular polysaccharide biosynthesis protein